jgi:hypothetical protein
MHILAVIIADLQIGPKLQNGDFIKYGLNGVDPIPLISGDHAPGSTAWVGSSGKHHLEARMRNTDFVKTGLILLLFVIQKTTMV